MDVRGSDGFARFFFFWGGQGPGQGLGVWGLGLLFRV